MDAVWLDRAGNVDQIFVEHGDEGSVVFLGQVSVEQFELLDILLTVVGRQRDSGKQGFDVGIFQDRQHGVKVAASFAQGQAAQAVVAAELD